ncbi:transport protein SEC7 [Verticillium alfalfae VaMs.102]|uniref:Transport protein SEC7 n=1 Tax=Verticillium alfalfae (strain VaMs.102 / ATCC MYA-4576 / FGSC 10136) TaxID=526221 RepID=C9SU80_VERA1|nr:transport protein SEC7 [Verticillium alfalfae VaMs.102]EEY22391.1 transport protein SEC7 [Verticillium alfalfae VaMs.102]
MSSVKFLVASLEAIAASKEAQRHKQLSESLQKTLEAVKEADPQLPDPEVVFAPLHQATKTGNTHLITSALDCIGKLISYSHFSAPPAAAASEDGRGEKETDGEQPPPLIERAIDTICGCFQGETTPVEIQLQIVKSLLAAVLNDKIVVHGAGLLKAVRQVYNVFLLSRSTANQQMAQGTLTQMVGTVFERVKTRLHMKEARLNLANTKNSSSNITFDPAEQANSVNGSGEKSAEAEEEDSANDVASDVAAVPAPAPDAQATQAKLTLKDLETRKSFDDSTLGEGPTMVTQIKPAKMERTESQSSAKEEDNYDELEAEDEVYIRDAYLVFRSFCNLSTKVLPTEQLYEVRGQPMRSKLISLHLIHTLMNNNITVFTSPLCTIRNSRTDEVTTFIQAIKYYICLSVTRNGASSVDGIFNVCAEIFWLVLKFMREQFKLEIAVFLNEIYLALLARRTAPASQKATVVTILNRFCADSRGLVEVYLNYDCEGNVDNLFQTIIEDLSKYSTAAVPITPGQEQQYEEKAARRRRPASGSFAPFCHRLCLSRRYTKIARRMSKEDFIKNNRGINDDADLPPEYLLQIYDEIESNEIVLKSERDAAAMAGNAPPTSTGIAAGLGQALSNMGRDLQREAYVQQSVEIASRSEQLFKNLLKTQRRNAQRAGVKFMPATSFQHIGPMFDVTWMSYFSALSNQMQKAQNIEVNKLCLEGMKLATKIACSFELSTPREAFVSALRNITNINNPQEMHAKNIEALKVILELGQTEGDLLRSSWKDVLLCISQLDRLQLISGGVDENAIPDVANARFERQGANDSRKSTHGRRPGRPRAGTGPQGFSIEVAQEARSDAVVKAVDRIFANTASLNGEAIVHFTRALTEVSWDEIRVSGSNDSPRTYSLQKIVEIAYYNMSRVRFEWTNIWEVMGEHFNRVGCHNNTNIVFFALDSLRQLSMNFLEIEELPGFKFQKDFLKPFEPHPMIQARGDNIRSGWRTMFGVFTVAAREQHEAIVNLAYENVSQVYKTKFGVVISQGAFTDLIVCLTEFSKNMKYQKKSLQALEALKSIMPRMLKTPECPLSHKNGYAPPAENPKAQDALQRSQTKTSVEEGYWFPVLFAFHDVLMTGEDLEVRSNALEYFFEALLKYGGEFPPEFWDILWRQQLNPIFMVLRSRPDLNSALNHEELSVWLSTTMIQALRNMITLFTHYFEALECMLDRFLELLALCIFQENDTISRIGSNCLQQLILKNVKKFTAGHWTEIVGSFCKLFAATTATQLFSPTTVNSSASLELPTNGLDFTGPLVVDPEEPINEKSLEINGHNKNGTDADAPATESTEEGADEDDLKTPTATNLPQAPLEDYKPASNLQQQPVVVTAARRRYFNQIISRCVLQLLMIETVNELFSNDTVYAQIPTTELLTLMALLKRSYLFARRFNADKELRMRLWREGFMKQAPNLLKQESGAAATRSCPLCKDIIGDFVALEEESQHRNILAWRPVVVDVLEGYAAFPEEAFEGHVKEFYPMVVELLGKNLSSELRAALLLVLRRVGEVGLGIEGMASRSGDKERRESVATVTTEGEYHKAGTPRIG